MGALSITFANGGNLSTISLDPQKLAGFTMAELKDVREGAVLAGDVLLGILQQPCYSHPGRNILNAAGEALDALLDAAAAIADAAEDEACRRTDAVGDDAKLRAFMLIRARIDRGDDSRDELEALVQCVGA